MGNNFTSYKLILHPMTLLRNKILGTHHKNGAAKPPWIRLEKVAFRIGQVYVIEKTSA